jgi:hypothetical protein
MVRRNYGKKTKGGKNTDEPTAPDWFDGENNKNDVQSRRKSSVHKVQHNRRTSDGRGSSRSGRRRSQTTSERNEGLRSQRNRSDYTGTSGDISGTEGESPVTKFSFTLKQIRDSLDDQTLKDLLNNRYDSTKIITIHKKIIKTSFAEDEIFRQNKLPQTKQRRKRTPTKQTPSMRFAQAKKEFDQGLNEGSAEAVLGVYFKRYLTLFGEEDPQWNGGDCKEAISTIKSFTNSVTAGNYRMVIVFIRKLMPLWKQRLVNGESFPNSRPTIDALFGGKRHFWANRKIYYRQWQSNQ